MKTVIVVPAYNEASQIASVLVELKNYGQVVVVDDGSTDNTFDLAQAPGVIVLKHIINRGLGGAIGTGLAMAKQLRADVVVTIDADGQMKAVDIPKLIEPIVNNQADVVLGIRSLNRFQMPLRRRIYNWLSNIITYLLFGTLVSDSQSGLRAFSKKSLDEIEINSNRMEVSSEIVAEIGRHRWRLLEVGIMPIYTEYSLSKGQSFVGGIKTAWQLLIQRLLE